MSQRTAVRGKLPLLAAGAVLAMLFVAPHAGATTVRINFGGAAGHGYADLTLAPDPNQSSSYSPLPVSPTPTLSSSDPAGAQYITGASGRFNGIAITGVQPTNSGTPPPLPGGGYETLPNSFSWFVSSAGQNSYDNLFYYPVGSPLVCPPVGPTPYTFHGGFLDIFGVMFSLADGGALGLWSDGVMPGGLTFGISVYTAAAGGGYDLDSFQFAGAFAAVPEPGFIWLFGAGLVGLLAWCRAMENRRRPHRIG